MNPPEHPRGAIKTTEELLGAIKAGKQIYVVPSFLSVPPIKLMFDEDPIRYDKASEPKLYLHTLNENFLHHYLFVFRLGEPLPRLEAERFRRYRFLFTNYWDAWAYAQKVKS